MSVEVKDYRDIEAACLVLEQHGYTPRYVAENETGLVIFQHPSRLHVPKEPLLEAGFYIPRTAGLAYFHFLKGGEKLASKGIPHPKVRRIWQAPTVDNFIDIGRERNLVRKGLALLVTTPARGTYHLVIEKN